MLLDAVMRSLTLRWGGKTCLDRTSLWVCKLYFMRGLLGDVLNVFTGIEPVPCIMSSAGCLSREGIAYGKHMFYWKGAGDSDM